MEEEEIWIRTGRETVVSWDKFGKRGWYLSARF